MSVPRYRWQPTTAEIAEAAGIAPGDVERFDHNTSPIPTSWAAAVVAGSSSRLNEYPAASYAALRSAAGAYAGAGPERIAVGAGADELILLAARAFLPSGAEAVVATPTYPLYAIAVAQVGGTLIEIPAAAPDFALPREALVSAAREAEMAWLCVPNNPTGVHPGGDLAAEVAEACSGVVVVDAAYAEFAGDSWTALTAEYDNLLVLHTLSKAFGIAGARVGYGIGHPDLVDAIDGVRPPGSIASTSVDLAIAALAEPARMRATVAELARARLTLATGLTELGMRVLPAATNFVLAEVGPRAKDLHAGLLAEGLVVRDFPAGSPLEYYLRFTVRTSRAHRRLLTSLEEQSK